MPNFRELSPNDVIEPNWLTDYEREMNIFHGRLVELNVSIQILGHLIRFPFDMLFLPEEYTFFRFAKFNFFGGIILGITQLLTDNDKRQNSLTLLHFKSQVVKAIKPTYTKEFRHYIANAEFDKRAKHLIDRVRYIRNKHIAHLDKNLDIAIDPKAVITLDEIKEICDDINKLFDAISFNVYWGKLYYRYDSDLGSKRRSDIEELLADLALKSPVLKAPEKDELWPDHREEMTQAELNAFNYWRKQCGLTEVN